MNENANVKQNLREVFLAVRQQVTAEDKLRVLDELCLGNENLRREVEHLLAASSNPSPLDHAEAMIQPFELTLDSVSDRHSVRDIEFTVEDINHHPLNRQQDRHSQSGQRFYSARETHPARASCRA